ncbi:MFS transporter [Actinomadura sp. NPDC048021]|uniref:MFS transporter n=1 Tax=Actinomadura sp. NPDC048021 TaxID=3155385 RepID=UPI00340307C3
MALGTALLGFVLISLDALIVTVALPDIGRGLGGGVFTFSLYFQQERGQSALHTGLLFVPMTALVAVVNLASARLAGRFGPRVPIAAGQLLGTAGLAALTTVGTHTRVETVAALMVPVGLGGALAVPALTASLLDAVPAERGEGHVMAAALESMDGELGRWGRPGRAASPCPRVP